MSLRALLIEDDETVADPLVEGLGRYGLTVRHVSTGTAGLRGPYGDIVLLDLGLPDIDGIDVCRGIREGSEVPIIMLTARGTEADRVLGLELGADDYLAKPFSIRELIARMRAVTRRTGAGAPRLRPGASGASSVQPQPGTRGDGPGPSEHTPVRPMPVGRSAYWDAGFEERLRDRPYPEPVRLRPSHADRAHPRPGYPEPAYTEAVYVWQAAALPAFEQPGSATQPAATEPVSPERQRVTSLLGKLRSQRLARQRTESGPERRADARATPRAEPEPVPASGSEPAVPPTGALVVDRRTRQVWVGDTSVVLTPKEFDLLALLAEDPGAVCSRQQILDRVWDPHFHGPTKTLDVHIATLRRKLGNPAWIQTLRGVGFRLAVRSSGPEGPRP
jgi:DNA-binding response OmpR family regulator